ncbi:MAG: hypothetical protein KC731_34205, partial [Myxococcales bacterium]|nr:hypothetical protein [Myxococcales bacterium]
MTLTGLAAAAALGLSASPAAAQPAEEGPTTSASVPDCPPGAFCEETTVAPPDDVPAPAETPMADEGDSTTVVLPPPPEGSDPAAPRTFTYHPDPNGGPGQIIIYE